MACDSTNTWLVLPLLLLFAANCTKHCVHGKSQVPCLFIFGDSLSDSGNNNNLPTSAKCNYKPYGIDFPIGPTGRFTNGRTVIDIITEFLGFENFIPPFADTSGSDILKGVNYASGAAGIRIETGTHAGSVISMGLQLTNHRVIVSEIATRLGGLDKAQQYLSKCLYYVNIGSNDYINNYFQPQLLPTCHIYSPEQYAEVLIDELSRYLLDLHDVGARKYVLVGLGLLGCTPNAINTRGTNGSCFEEENAAAFIFNGKLKSLVDLFNDKFSANSKFIFINSTAQADADLQAQHLGFKNFIPPYANTSGSDILQGVNYASGAAGIRNETGTQLGSDVSLELQMTHHRDIISKIANKLGGLGKAQQHLSQCLYYFNIGSNDYLNNYFVPEHFPTSRKFNPEQYAEALIQQYSRQLRALYQTRARKFTLIGLGLVGCIPHEVKRHGATACVEEENKAALIFNDKLKALVDQFNKELSDSKFVFVDPALITSNSPILSGLRGFTHRCCEVLENGQCIPNKTPCQYRNMHVFMDEFHPTEIINQVLGTAIYAASIPTLTSPFDIRNLVMS